MQVKKGYKDKVGIILYNVESGDGSGQDGFQELVAMGDLNCQKIQLMQEHAKSGSYVETSKTNSAKPSKKMFHENNQSSCYLTNAIRAAQQVGLSPVGLLCGFPHSHGFPCTNAAGAATQQQAWGPLFFASDSELVWCCDIRSHVSKKRPDWRARPSPCRASQPAGTKRTGARRLWF